MANAQLRYQGPADAKRTPAPDFKVGDQVYVKAKYFRSTRPSKKLSEKNLGPYSIIMQVGSLSFTLRLPDSMRAVHPVFHVSQLEPAIPNTILDWIQPPPPLVKVDGEPEFEISEILDSKVDRRRKSCKLLYLVRWSSYEGTDEETSWLLATELGNATELLENYHVLVPIQTRTTRVHVVLLSPPFPLSVSLICFPYLFHSVISLTLKTRPLFL